MPHVQADRFELIYPGQNLWLPDGLTVLSVWMESRRHPANIDFHVSLGLSRVPLRMAILAEHSNITEQCPKYVGITVEPLIDKGNCLVPTTSRCQLCIGTELCTPQIFVSPQHTAAWHKYVACDSRFAKDPITYKSFVERATLAFTDSTGAPYQYSAKSALYRLCGEVEFTTLVEIFLVPDPSASREQQASVSTNQLD